MVTRSNNLALKWFAPNCLLSDWATGQPGGHAETSAMVVQVLAWHRQCLANSWQLQCREGTLQLLERWQSIQLAAWTYFDPALGEPNKAAAAWSLVASRPESISNRICECLKALMFISTPVRALQPSMYPVWQRERARQEECSLNCDRFKMPTAAFTTSR